MVRVLVVDDSALVRSVLVQGLSADSAIEVVGAAGDPYQARDMIVRQNPDVLTLDVEMPRMNGVEFLRRLMPQHPLPVVMVSALTERGKRITLDALEAGAVDFVAKPRANVAHGLGVMMRELRSKVKIAAAANVSAWRGRKVVRPKAGKLSAPLSEATEKAIIIGASTGGTEAIRAVVTALPATTPGVVVVQHMPGGFTRKFADRLDEQSVMAVKEAEDGDRIFPGRVLIAPGEFQLEVKRTGGLYRVAVRRGERVSGHCPSVDVLMRSAATALGPHAVGVILTGMGKDGAAGLKAMRDAGARTLGQDEATCVVYGMPKVAHLLGAVERQLPLQDIAQGVLGMLTGAPR